MRDDEPRPKLKRVSEDTFAALVRVYMESPKFKGYSAGTQDTWGRELRHAARPDLLGWRSLQDIRPSLIQAYLDGLAGRPGKQAVAYSVFKQMEKWAIVREL